MTPVRGLLVASLLAHVLAAWFNAGPFQPDEHFQILEFAAYKLGTVPAQSLAWEFAEQARPALQPALAWAAFRLFGALGVSDPFLVVFALRLGMGLLGLSLTLVILRHGLPSIRSAACRRFFITFSLVFAYLPFLHGRFTSENAAGLALFSGAFLVLRLLDPDRPRRSDALWALAGVLLVLAFYFRFQVGFAIAGLGAWLLWQRPSPRIYPPSWPG